MKKLILLTLWVLLGLGLTACGPTVTQVATTVATTPLPPMATPTATLTLAPTETPATPEPAGTPVVSGLPFEPGPQPNGAVVTQDVQQADLTGDGVAESIIISSWQDPASDNMPMPLEVDVATADGQVLYTRDTWEGYGMESPSEIALDDYSFFMYDWIEAAELRDLTGSGLPQLVVRLRHQGTGGILDLYVVSFADGWATELFTFTAYKGNMDYLANGLEITQPLYLYNEANCCPCRWEKYRYTWNGETFVAESRVREALPDIGGGADCPAYPQPAVWQALTVSGPQPAARHDAALAFDAVNQRVLLFGGQSGATTLNDTWAFDLASRTWQELTSAVRPPARYSMVAGIDAMQDRLLITAGEAQSGQLFNDVWAFDLNTNTWSEVRANGESPAARYGAGGGIHSYSDALYLTHGFTDEGRFDDTWAFDLATNTWRNLTPAGELPLKRCLHAVAVTWDRLVLFGGCSSPSGPCPQGDGWQLDLSTNVWQPLPGTGPSARQLATLTELEDRGEAWLFGGQDAAGQDLNDLWALDLATGRWRALQPQGTAPAARHSQSVVWVSDWNAPYSNYLLLFGGQSGSADLNDLWILTSGDE